MELVSVIVPAYGNPPGLNKTLRSLAALEDTYFEIIVVDDASPEPLSLPPGISKASLIRLNRNQGAGMARNEGAKRARGGILAFTDSDCAVPKDWLKIIRRAFQDDSVDAVAGTFILEPQRSAITWLRALESTYYHLHERRLVHCFTSSNFAIRKPIFEESAGFPPLRIGEDLILGYRLYLAGHEILWLPELKVAQDFRPTFRQYFKQQHQWSAAALSISLQYPEVNRMKWPVRKTSPNLQLILSLLFFFLWPFLPPYAGLVLLGFLLALNAPFLVYAKEKSSIWTAVKVFIAVIFWRNLAWMSAVFSVVLTKPALFIGAFRSRAFPSRSRAPVPRP